MQPTDVPYLTTAALEKEVQRLARHKRTLLAFFGTGDRDHIAVDGKGKVEVVPIRSELDLRAQMPGLDESPLRAYLVPWTGVIPDDLAGRFVNNGSIYRIGPAVQLAALTGGTQPTEDAMRAVLASYLLRRDNPVKRYLCSGQELNRVALYEAWLRTDWRVPTEGGLARDTLLGWAAADGRGGFFIEAMQAPAAVGLREELDAVLKEPPIGDVGPLIWRAWAKGSGLQLLGFAILSETLAARPEAFVKMWLRKTLKSIVAIDANADAQQLATALGATARSALTWIRHQDPKLPRRALLAAEALVEPDDDDIRACLIDNTRLTTAWELLLGRLSEQLLGFIEDPSRKSLEAVQHAWRTLEKHDFFAFEEQSELVRRAEMVVRLASWLCVRPDRLRETGSANYAEVETLGSWYAEEGGFVDWARRSARSLNAGPLALGAQAIVRAADAAREDLDRRFAAALDQWIHAGRPSKNVLPIDAALERVAARFLNGGEDRSLLVLLMDGMAWAQAVELLPSLGTGGRRWGPIAWHHIGPHRIGTGSYPVMLAALPTVTEVSRSAFFAGKSMTKGSQLSTAKDPERFGSHKALQPFCDPQLKPRLLLRGDGHTSDGALSEEARQMIQSVQERRVVGLVVNAIDASLKGDSQQEHRWDVESIRSLPQILDAAKAAGRHVLLASDHGHVPADRLKTLSAGAGGGARWRVWGGDRDTLEPGERKYSGEGVYVPKGAEAVVLLETDALRYGGGAHAGEHGGAGLAEVIAPCLLLGWEDEATLQPHPELAVRGLFVPDWWSGALPRELGAVQHDEPPPRRKSKKDAVSDQQISLPGLAPAPTPSPPPKTPVPDKPEALLPSLYESEMLKARTKEVALRRLTVKAVHFLLQRSGAAPEVAFGAHLETPPFRVPGLVSKLQEVLNLDGYEVLRYDRKNLQIFLDKAKLEQQFEVKL